LKYVHAEVAEEICRHALIRRGASDEHANWFAHALVDTSLMGIDTHGLRLLGLYLRELDEGRSNATPSFKITRQHAGTVALDGDAALGTVAGTRAARLAVELARKNGISAVAVRNSNHFGAASVYGAQIAAQGLVGMVTTSAAARMAPFNGTQPMFGTNPICFAAPADNEDAFLFDMATSQISYSQIKHYRKHNQKLPLGWVLDCDGEYTESPDEVVSLAPLGGYKGQGLAMMVQILSAVLTGMPLDHELDHLDTGRFDTPRKIGHFLLAIDVARFTDPSTFRNEVSNLMSVVRNTPSKKGTTVLVAGDVQKAIREQRLANGIPVSAEELAALLQEGSHANVPESRVLVQRAEVAA
jgi:LDH2 family malate/lactate/ureidoglycolate dehydrogenase